MEEKVEENIIRCKLRLDFLGVAKPSKFFIGGKDMVEVAEEVREKEIMVWQNIPMQGIEIEHIEQKEPYTIFEEMYNEEVAYAPVEIILTASSCSDLLPLILKPELRKIDIYEPDSIRFTRASLEKLFIKTNEELHKQIHKIRRQLES